MGWERQFKVAGMEVAYISCVYFSHNAKQHISIVEIKSATKC